MRCNKAKHDFIEHRTDHDWHDDVHIYKGCTSLDRAWNFSR